MNFRKHHISLSGRLSALIAAAATCGCGPSNAPEASPPSAPLRPPPPPSVATPPSSAQHPPKAIAAFTVPTVKEALATLESLLANYSGAARTSVLEQLLDASAALPFADQLALWAAFPPEIHATSALNVHLVGFADSSPLFVIEQYSTLSQSLPQGQVRRLLTHARQQKLG